MGKSYETFVKGVFKIKQDKLEHARVYPSGFLVAKVKTNQNHPFKMNFHQNGKSWGQFIRMSSLFVRCTSKQIT